MLPHLLSLVKDIMRKIILHWMLDDNGLHSHKLPWRKKRSKSTRYCGGFERMDWNHNSAVRTLIRPEASPRSEAFFITNGVKCLQSIAGVDGSPYIKAVKMFEDVDWREMFMAMSAQRKLVWLASLKWMLLVPHRICLFLPFCQRKIFCSGNSRKKLCSFLTENVACKYIQFISYNSLHCFIWDLISWFITIIDAALKVNKIHG